MKDTVFIVRTNYDCMDLYFGTKKKAIKFVIDDNMEQNGRTNEFIREEELQ